MKQRIQRRGIFVASITAAVIAAACADSRGLVGPDMSSPARLDANAIPSSALLTSTVASGLYVPHTNVEMVPWTSTGAALTDNQAVRIRVTGALSYAENSLRFQISGLHVPVLPPIGPAGMTHPYPGGAQVLARLVQAGGQVVPIELNPQWDPAAAETKGYVQGAGQIEYMRTTLGAGTSCTSNVEPPAVGQCYGDTYSIETYDYNVSGSQQITVEPLDSATVTADQARVLPGTNVTFTAHLGWAADNEWSIQSNNSWIFVESANGHGHNMGCYSYKECRYEVTTPGYVLLGVGGPGGTHWLVHGPEITIGPPDDHCTPVAPGSPSARAGCSDGDPPPDNQIVLKIEPARTEVEPLVDGAPNFNATTQVATHCAAQPCATHQAPAARRDTSRIRIRASFLPSHRPAAGVSVSLVATAFADSGGHFHTTATARPTGTFFGDEAQAQVDVPDAGTRGNISVQLGADGTAEVVYRTSGVGGVERLTAEVIAQGLSARDTNQVKIRLNGLVSIPSSGSSWVFQASSQHNGGDTYLAPGVLAAMELLWQNYRDSAVANPDEYPMHGTRFTVTAVSLIWGGLYDHPGHWSNPHKLHRTGHDVDFDDDDAEGDTQQMEEHCIRFQFAGQAIRCELHNDNHFHAYVGQ